MTDSHGGEHVAVGGAPQGSVAASKIVVIERHGSPLAATLAECLAGVGCELRVYASRSQALDALPGLGALVVLAECAAAGDEGPALVKQVAAADPRARTVLVVAQCSVPEAVAAMRAGAFGCLGKPVVAGELLRVIEAAARHPREPATRKESAELARDALGLEAIIGSSPPMVQLKSRLRCLVDAETGMRDRDHAAVLITGETGTGKELAARALHFDGMRREGPFVEVNCSSLPLQLLESELFGHERGAFTDAKERKVGLVEAAEGGTLFLDEIGEVDLAIQAKLLKLLEERSVRRVGSTRERKVDVRIVSATNQDLERMVREGGFREDLYYRLKVVPLYVPPLRERREDVAPLARLFMERFSKQFKKGFRVIAPAAERVLLDYGWPGNIRELKNLMERTVLLETGETLEPHHLKIGGRARPAAEATLGQRLDDSLNGMLPGNGLPFESLVEELERALILRASHATNWNQSRTAEMLNLKRDKLRYRMKLYQIRNGQQSPENTDDPVESVDD